MQEQTEREEPKNRVGKWEKKEWWGQPKKKRIRKREFFLRSKVRTN